MAKAPQEHVDKLRKWMQFNDNLMQIDPTYHKEWQEFKKDWDEDEDFKSIIEELQTEEGNFNWEYYASYYQCEISHIYGRILWGYEVLVENACDPELDYLDYNKEIKNLEKENEELKEKLTFPTDEEIEEMGKDVIVYNDTKRGWFIEGMKVMRDLINFGDKK